MNIFITGASKGIGRAAALRFAAKGWFVGITDIDTTGLRKLESEITGKDYYVAIMDVTDEAAVESTIGKFCEKCNGELNVLLNNAGVACLDPFEEIPPHRHHAIIDVNTRGVVNCTFHAFPYLKRTKNARVINMCSAASHYGVPFEATYSASKFFVKGFTEALNIEWERHGIHVCDIMPNFVDTPMMEQCNSAVVERVGIKLTAEDVVDKIWSAVHKKRVHWLVEFFPYNIFQPIARFLPRSIVRAVVKRTADL